MDENDCYDGKKCENVISGDNVELLTETISSNQIVKDNVMMIEEFKDDASELT